MAEFIHALAHATSHFHYKTRIFKLMFYLIN